MTLTGPRASRLGRAPPIERLLVLALLAAVTLFQHVLAKDRPVARPAADAAPADENAQLAERFRRARQLAAKEQACLMKPGCATDEGRWLDAMAAGRTVLETLAVKAAQGDAEAAYQRGALGLEVLRSHREGQSIESRARFPATARVLSLRVGEEMQQAEHFLAMAAVKGHPRACLVLARHLAAEHGPPPEGGLVSQLFRCAVVGFNAKKDHAAASEAYGWMQASLGPRDPWLVEAHAIVFRDKVPYRAWRTVEPEQVESLRRSAAP